jgi:CHAT domain-containing protein/tetratricopeptide (TPR) repeat protein
MGKGQLLRFAVALIATGLIVAAGPLAAQVQSAEDLTGHFALLKKMSELYRAGKYAEAIQTGERDLALAEQKFGPDHSLVTARLNILALFYNSVGNYAEAESLYQRILAHAERTYRPDASRVPFIHLAELYIEQGRYAEAEPLCQRVITMTENTFGTNHGEFGQWISKLATIYMHQGRYAQAELLFKRAGDILEKAYSPEAPEMGDFFSKLAELYQAQGRYAEAEPLYKRALAVAEGAAVYSSLEWRVGVVLHNMALLYREQGRYAQAEQLANRALAETLRRTWPEHPRVAAQLSDLALLYFVQGDWRRAIEYWRRSTDLLVRRAQRHTTFGERLTGKRKSETEQESHNFWRLIKAAYRLAIEGRGADANLRDESFQMAQRAQDSEAATSLAQMAVRGAKGDAALAAVVRERQDLLEDWHRRDALRSADVAKAPDKRDRQAETVNLARLASIDVRIAELDKRLSAEFPGYLSLAQPDPLTVKEVQARLSTNEVLVLFLDTPQLQPTPEETFIWTVSKTDVRLLRSELGAPSLQREVAALRCGLDYDGIWGASGSGCQHLLQVSYTETEHQGGKPLPFDRERAHGLYKALFGQIEDLIKDKQLLIVPSGALTQLPFQVLVTEKPNTVGTGDDTYRRTAWLIRKHALTVLPSVSSLKALRQLAKGSHADRAMIGFGNPLLNGSGTRYEQLARAARFKQSCPLQVEQRLAALSGDRRGILPLDLRRGLADVTQIREQMPLPETADELCAVAHDMGVSGDDVRLGSRATEAEIKRLSEAGELAKYRIIHFATHGALAGQLSGNSEPGLLLTPPDTATEGDDGYLSASEIASLKLDADWVILSACNTAAGGVEGAEALSGLARAFFYAGARALLVSHWAVYSEATVKLITGAVERMAAAKSVGRAEAMRQSMLALIDKGKVNEAHPSYWAPFVVVGEGAAAK